MLPWLLCAALALAVLALAVKMRLLHDDMDRLAADVAALLAADTNARLSVRGADRHLRRLAAALDRELRALRRQRRRYECGNRKLETAVTDISHDLRTPLTALCGYLALLEKEDVSPRARRYLDIIGDRARALTAMTEELFRYSLDAAREDMPLAPVDMRRAVETAMAGSFALLRKRGIEPRIHMPAEPVMCLLNAPALERVMENILSNAAKYSPGDLAVTLDETGALAFENHAPGLDKIQVGRLFDRFYTVESVSGSTGLGLSIARMLTERMGGRVDAAYDDGKLTIHLRFPTI